MVSRLGAGAVADQVRWQLSGAPLSIRISGVVADDQDSMVAHSDALIQPVEHGLSEGFPNPGAAPAHHAQQVVQCSQGSRLRGILRGLATTERSSWFATILHSKT